jgi:seryl-tRNA synthetase
MLDIKYIRENSKVVEKAAASKGVSINIATLLDLDKKRVSLIEKRDTMRSARKFEGKPSAAEIAKVKKDNTGLLKVEADLLKIEEKWMTLMLSIPNPPLKDVTIGDGEADNKVVRKVGKPTKLGFKAKDHIELTDTDELIDLRRGAKVSGSRFAYLKGRVAQQEIALIN